MIVDHCHSRPPFQDCFLASDDNGKTPGHQPAKLGCVDGRRMRVIARDGSPMQAPH